MSSSILGKIDISDYCIEDEINYLNNIYKIPEEYDEFAQGYWKNISLFNASGNPDDSQYRYTESAVPTKHANNCPEIKRLINDVFDTSNIKMVRARNLIDGLVIPHKDFVELDNNIKHLRIFIPLESNIYAYHSDESGVFQMQRGEIWYLDANINHAAVNFSSESRMCICVDFMYGSDLDENNTFFDKFKKKAGRNSYLIDRKEIDNKEIDTIIYSVSTILNKQTFKDIIFALSKFHFIYNIPIASCYEWIIKAAEISEDYAVRSKAINLRRYLLEKRDIGERFTINKW